MFILNVRYALIGDELELVEEVSLIYEGGRLAGIDEGWDSKGITANALAMPGLINSHAHLGDSAFPEAWADKDLSEIVDPSKGLKRRELERLDRKEIINSMTHTLEKMKNYGIMAVADFREQGVKGVRMGLEAARRASYSGYLPMGRFEDEKEMLKLVEVAHGLGLPEPDYPSLALAKRASALFRSFGKPVGTHVAEVGGPEELYMAMEEVGVNFVVHGINLEREHFTEMRRRGISLAICPRANVWFKKTPKIHYAIEEDVNLLLGTDNAAWTSPNLWRDLEVSALLIRKHGSWSEEVARKLLKAVTVNAKEPLKIPWEIAIKKGSDGPVILLDVKELDLERARNKYTAIVKRSSPLAVIGRIEKGRYKVHE
ncbi:hypothetical protein IPA_07385 [Ignicoccus pacificus DSM 13166]|uniref:Amidohydrolase-related domain-containing protein n=1 Tax=Ignicoccus pacificus DSM 13166 TaxID=940294 RepID=A0A977KBL0_9CREN|nr:hypothetical protein IPA_07385 [Ignicoccus pacificus DSM 13166]